jgi:hypothetical protein
VTKPVENIGAERMVPTHIGAGLKTNHVHIEAGHIAQPLRRKKCLRHCGWRKRVGEKKNAPLHVLVPVAAVAFAGIQ